MQIILEIPDELAAIFGNTEQAVARAALEAVADHGVRTGTLSEAEARKLLGLSRYEMDQFLNARGINHALTYEEFLDDAANAAAFAQVAGCK